MKDINDGPRDIALNNSAYYHHLLVQMQALDKDRVTTDRIKGNINNNQKPQTSWIVKNI